MGTTYSISIYDYQVNLDTLKYKIDSLLNNINLQMSTYIKNSEISKINKGKSGNYEVSEDFLKVVDKALAYYKINNRYDITIKPLVDLWGFGTSKEFKIPDSSKITDVLQYVGSEKILIQNNQIVKLDNNVEIDLSSIAKGFAVDKVSDFLSNSSYINHTVEIGGEMRTSGYKNNENWNIGILSPLDNKLVHTVKIHNKSLATSGTYNNFFTIRDVDYSHLINPLTGYPIKHNVKSVSVIANNCIDADALATLVIINENPYDAIKLINKIESVDVMILLLDDDEKVIKILSDNFTDYIIN